MKGLQPPPLAVIVAGPTCGGKSRLAEKIADQMNWPVQVMDSMKVYRGMDIGTAKPAPDRRQGRPFTMVDLVDPWQDFTVFDWLEALAEIAPSDRPWLFSGGTNFYLHALREGIFAGPGADPEVRRRLSQEGQTAPAGTLHQRLTEVDEEAARQIHPNNHKRIIRALEVFEVSGEPITVWHRRRVPIIDAQRTLLLGVQRPREEIHLRIARRIEVMFKAGWVAEVEQLLANHDPPWSRTAAQSIGYQQIATALREGTDPVAQFETIQVKTRALVRAQMAWARKLPIEWYSAGEQSLALERVQQVMSAVESGSDIPAAAEGRLKHQEEQG
ncbi:MAG: tRNA (adenosine(37)-N6)-dimethylallyltransferase MiaA [Planctomycetota bacterium]|nr:tRNA (adenosine(37)-N6)-dimethylallyltransferase MiaA [Planctomycetota bacterium]